MELIPQDLLRKYLIYARERVHPILEQVQQGHISKLYAAMRKESGVNFAFISSFLTFDYSVTWTFHFVDHFVATIAVVFAVPKI